MNTIVPVQLSVISEEYIREYILKNFQFESVEYCDIFHYGSFLQNYRLKTESGIYWFRIFITNLHQKEQIEEEVKIINYAVENGIMAAKAVQRSDSKYISSFNAPEGIRYGVLFRNIVGDKPDIRNETHLNLIGKDLAVFHKKMKYFSGSGSRVIDDNFLVKEPLNIIKEWLTDHDFEKVSYTANKYRKTIKELLEEKSEFKTICHGDLNQKNLFISENIVSFIDFESCGLGYRSYDLGCFKRKIFLTINDPKERVFKWHIFLKSYIETTRLEQKEIQAIDYFLFLRTLWVMSLAKKFRNGKGNWLSESGYLYTHLLQLHFFTIK